MAVDKNGVRLHSPCRSVNDSVCPGSVLTAPSLTLTPESRIACAVPAVFHVTGQAPEELRIRVGLHRDVVPAEARKDLDAHIDRREALRRRARRSRRHHMVEEAVDQRPVRLTYRSDSTSK